MEFIDLGLNVKWAKYNLGATHGSDSKSWYGDYYAWGETETKTDYSGIDGKYKWGTIDYNEKKSKIITNLTKYNTKIDYGAVDNLTTLQDADDVIKATYGGMINHNIKSFQLKQRYAIIVITT